MSWDKSWVGWAGEQMTGLEGPCAGQSCGDQGTTGNRPVPEPLRS